MFTLSFNWFHNICCLLQENLVCRLSNISALSLCFKIISKGNVNKKCEQKSFHPTFYQSSEADLSYGLLSGLFLTGHVTFSAKIKVN